MGESFGAGQEKALGSFPGGQAFNLGAGATRPGLQSDLSVDINAGGLRSKTSDSRVKVRSTPARQALVNSLAGTFTDTAKQLSQIRSLATPGFSAFREAGLQEIGTRRQAAIGNLRDNLARRRVLGSSFADDALIRGEAEFAKEASEFAAATTLQELDTQVQLIQAEGQQLISATQTQLQELNLQADIALALQGRAAQALSAASIQQQQNAQAFTQGVMEIAGTAAAACSMSLKDEVGKVETLEKIQALPIQSWVYKGDDVVHIGPYAEDFQRSFGVGDGKTIWWQDVFGVLLQGVKELSARVEELEKR